MTSSCFAPSRRVGAPGGRSAVGKGRASANRRFYRWWHTDGRWARPLNRLDRFQQIHCDELAGDGTLSPANKCGAGIDLAKCGKGTQTMLLADGTGTPLSAFTLPANVAEVNAIQHLIESRVIPGSPRHLLYDKAADADWLREALASPDLKLICPHRANRTKLSGGQRPQGGPDASCAAVGIIGKSNAPMPGCTTTAASRFKNADHPSTSWDDLNLPVFHFPSAVLT